MSKPRPLRVNQDPYLQKPSACRATTQRTLLLNLILTLTLTLTLNPTLILTLALTLTLGQPQVSERSLPPTFTGSEIAVLSHFLDPADDGDIGFPELR